MAQQSEIPSAKHGEENFVCLLEDNARRLSAQPALLWNGGELSWAELDQRASGFAHFLAGQGVEPGDRIATLIANRWSFAVALLGILKLGATAATLHLTLKPEELAEVVADLQPRLVVEDVTVDRGSWNTARPDRRSRADRLVYRQFDGAAQNFVTAREFKSFSPG
jgi:acyl-CoA synthetase (AMP-forming)/AMP-acid ligase II